MKSFLTILLALWGFNCYSQQNNILLGLGTNGINIGFEKQTHKQFSLGGSFSLLQVYGNVKNVIFDNQISTDYQTNSGMIEGFLKWYPRFRAENENNKTPKRFFAKAGLAFRFNPTYSALSKLKEKTLIGTFEPTEDQVGYVDVGVRTNKLQPMLALGYTIIDKKRFFINTEIGTYFHGRPKVNIEATGTLRLNTANQEIIQQKINTYQYYPLLKFETGIKL